MQLLPGKKDMEDVIAKAKNRRWGCLEKRRSCLSTRSIVLTKGQQDYLTAVRGGRDHSCLIGATTENPYFEVNGALLSRSIIFELKPLRKRGYQNTDFAGGHGHANAVWGHTMPCMDEEAADFLADSGRRRCAVPALDCGGAWSPDNGAQRRTGRSTITLAVASECIQKRVVPLR